MSNNEFLPAKQNDTALMPTTSAEEQRAIAQVQSQVMMAKRFPRDTFEAFNRIQQACKRVNLAKQALYAYPRGGQTVTGPSIRLAEAVAMEWGNIDFGIVELDQSNGKSQMMAYAWDLERNVRQTKIFQVEHVRYTRNAGKKNLIDPRDVYETTANNGARRLRACLLGVIPGDVIEAAEDQCRKTLAGQSNKPLEDRIRDLLNAFSEFGIKKEHIEKRLGHNIDSIIEIEFVNLGAIYKSLKDGVAKREDFFEILKTQEKQTLKKPEAEPKIEPPKDDVKKKKEAPKEDEKSVAPIESELNQILSIATDAQIEELKKASGITDFQLTTDDVKKKLIKKLNEIIDSDGI